MADNELAKLRRARSRCHKQLKKVEELIEGHRVKLADLETRIREIAPKLDMPARFRKPNLIFARGGLTRYTVLRKPGSHCPSR